MVVNKQKTKLRLMIVLFIITLALMALGYYYYFIKHKEPTHGIFVYQNSLKEEGLISGDLH